MARRKTAQLTEINKQSMKPLKVRFCPACKSTDVGFVFRLYNLFGLMPRVECTRCGHSAVDFPLLVIDNPQKTLSLRNKKHKKTQKKQDGGVDNGL